MRIRPSEAAASSSASGDQEPVFGSVSVSGRSRYMEDAVAVRTAISRPEITEQRPVHFFAVFDGHDGPHVSELCKERLHVIMEEEMRRLRWVGEEKEDEGLEGRYSWWRRVIERSFQRLEEEALNTCTCGRVAHKCCFHVAGSGVGGSTAVVAVLTPDHIVVANVGDSRAVLCRDGLVFPLSRDHKPDRSDEFARIQAAGGRVINFVNGARVEGILAMSRAIGDRHLKPYVIAEPEITFTKRVREDMCLIIGSYGLWDVMSNELVCKVACECLCEGTTSPATTSTSLIDPDASVVNLEPRNESERDTALYPSRSALAASLLTRLALGRRSSHNISAIVIDLKHS